MRPQRSGTCRGVPAPRLIRPAAVPLVVAALAAFPSLGAAQSFLGYRSVGIHVLPADGRTVAVGNLGIGLAEVELSVTDPSAAARLAMPTISLSMQPTWGTFELGSETGASRTTRFPLVGVGFPFPRVRGAATLSLTGFLEQQWAGQRTESVIIGGHEAFALDRYEASGGTSVASFGWAQRLGSRLAAGVSAGAYVGQLDRTFERAWDSLPEATPVQPYREAGRWRYSGFRLTAGLSGRPHQLVHAAAAVEWSGDISETPDEYTEGDLGTYEVPLRLSGGLTARLAPRLAFNASAAWQDWSSAAGYPDGVLNGGGFSFGTGLEWRAVVHETRSFPLRMGFRRIDPAFRYLDGEATESVLSLGAGLNLIELAGNRFGWADLALERGWRSSDPLRERYWRATVSVGISRS